MVFLKIRVSKEEREKICDNAYRSGYGGNVSGFMRGVMSGEVPVRPRYSTAEKRPLILTFRVKEAYKAQLEEGATRYSLTLSEYIRNRLTGYLLLPDKKYI